MREGIFAHWPNRITMLRFVGSLVLFLVLSLWGESDPRDLGAAPDVCFWLFLLIAFSDYLDGYLARRGNHITAFGRIADPFVDKVLVIGTMIYLAVLDWSDDWFPAWIVVLVVAREFLVTGIRGYVESQGLAFPADWFGKVKMIVQCIAIGVVLGLFAFDWPAPLRRFLEVAGHVFVWGTLLTTVGSGTSYVLKTRRLLAPGKAA
ncbi:MAG TPA: CDP-diacylglycerol--glycerol-3-phosphate 3-phosphatidyltransferase [Planctomycetota bacterium]